MDEVKDAIKKLPSGESGSFGALPGDWRYEWGSSNGRAFPKAAPRMLPLKLTNSALPDVVAGFVGKYQRAGKDGGLYEEISVFKVEGSDALAALVLSGTWSSGSSSGEWGAGARRERCFVSFETLRVAVSSEDPDASRSMLEARGLSKFLEPMKVDEKSGYFDLTFVNPALQVHQTEAGPSFVLTKMTDGPIPFDLE